MYGDLLWQNSHRTILLHAFDFTTWRVQPVIVPSPLHQQIAGIAGTRGLFLKCKGCPMDLIDHHVALGFKGISEPGLRRLYSHYSFEAPPILEAIVKADAAMVLGG